MNIITLFALGILLFFISRELNVEPNVGVQRWGRISLWFAVLGIIFGSNFFAVLTVGCVIVMLFARLYLPENYKIDEQDM